MNAAADRRATSMAASRASTRCRTRNTIGNDRAKRHRANDAFLFGAPFLLFAEPGFSLGRVGDIGMAAPRG